MPAHSLNTGEQDVEQVGWQLGRSDSAQTKLNTDKDAATCDLSSFMASIGTRPRLFAAFALSLVSFGPGVPTSDCRWPDQPRVGIGGLSAGYCFEHRCWC